MRSKIVVIGSIVLAGTVARDNRVSACAIQDTDTDPVDQQFFMCQGAPNPLPDPITGQMDPRPSIFFAPFGRDVSTPPPGCNSPLVILPIIPRADCSTMPCPDPNQLSGTGDRQWSFFIQDDDRWHLDNNEWSSQGKSNTIFYNPNQPYSKILNAAYLAWYGLKDDETKMFHGTQDYVNLLRANDSNDWHSKYFRSMDLGTDKNGEWSFDPIGDDEIATSCNLYDPVGGTENNLVFRLGTLIHESWHAWENGSVHLGSIGHKVATELSDCQPPNVCDCTIPGESCDFFFTHDAATFHPFGKLHEFGFAIASPPCPLPTRLCALITDPKKFHSPNQTKWEFMCDLLVSPADWVTQDILDAASVAQGLTDDYFVHAPPMDCAAASPMMLPI
jgi:hypothetical protein